MNTMTSTLEKPTVQEVVTKLEGLSEIDKTVLGALESDTPVSPEELASRLLILPAIIVEATQRLAAGSFVELGDSKSAPNEAEDGRVPPAFQANISLTEMGKMARAIVHSGLALS